MECRTGAGVWPSATRQVIAATLAVHYTWLEKLSLSYKRLETPPNGALVLAIQACRHIISQWLTGSRLKPAGQLANFAASNWADRKDRDGPSNIVETRLTSDVFEVVEQIKKEKWESIAKITREYMQTSMKPGKADLGGAPALDEPRVKRTFKLIDDDDESSSDEDGLGASAGSATVSTTKLRRNISLPVTRSSKEPEDN
ncbi:hypothetical protein H0H92_005144 [Tricholoma furcatifolium]|nr:hypothetical protein H0H92_010190 [Tricholoma furcatifolium]KAG6823532.1 hypothetical protein H0H92_009885 [Tricholoma furcatifolium]KAG6824995.1 hypothetical protein H0H92_005144 [Tricholoma furcatifolium]